MNNNLNNHITNLRKIGIQGNFVTTKDVESYWYRYLKEAEEVVSRGQARKFVKKVLQAYSAEWRPELIDTMVEECDSDGIGLSSEQFKLLAVTVFQKLKAPMQEGLLQEVLPRNQKVMDMFSEYIRIPFSEAEHNPLVIQFWKKAYLDDGEPPIPSPVWGKLGFQGTNPATDFRGSGLCGIHCLLVLVEQSEFFHHLLQSSQAHQIPLATAGINVVMIVFEFLGWGFKSPGVPSTRSPIVLRSLLKILFDQHDNDDPTGAIGLKHAQNAFGKLFILIFGIMEKIWTSMKASYFDFPQVIPSAVDRVEEILKLVRNRFTLDLFLKESFKLDIKFVYYGREFKIWMDDGKYKAIPYNPQVVLRLVLEKLCKTRGWQTKNFRVMDPSNKEITDLEQKLIDLGTNEISFLSKTPPPKIPVPATNNVPLATAQPSTLSEVVLGEVGAVLGEVSAALGEGLAGLGFGEKKKKEAANVLPPMPMPRTFKIRMEEDKYKIIPFKSGSILKECLQKLSQQRGLDDDYVARWLSGKEIENLDVTLESLECGEIYYVPRSMDITQPKKKETDAVESESYERLSSLHLNLSSNNTDNENNQPELNSSRSLYHSSKGKSKSTVNLSMSAFSPRRTPQSLEKSVTINTARELQSDNENTEQKLPSRKSEGEVSSQLSPNRTSGSNTHLNQQQQQRLRQQQQQQRLQQQQQRLQQQQIRLKLQTTKKNRRK